MMDDSILTVLITYKAHIQSLNSFMKDCACMPNRITYHCIKAMCMSWQKVSAHVNHSGYFVYIVRVQSIQN